MNRAALVYLKRGLEAFYGEQLVRLVLFGSQARGDATDDSDMDLMVVLRGEVDPRAERRRVLPLLVGLSLEHEELASVQIVSEARYAAGQDPLMLNVRREGVTL